MLPVGIDLTYHQDQTQKAGKRRNYKIQIYHSIIFAADKIIEKGSSRILSREAHDADFSFFYEDLIFLMIFRSVRLDSNRIESFSINSHN